MIFLLSLSLFYPTFFFLKIAEKKEFWTLKSVTKALKSLISVYFLNLFKIVFFADRESEKKEE